VAATVELRARFAEEAKHRLARRMEKAGVHVVYGMPSYKTQCNICLSSARSPGASALPPLHRKLQ